MIIRIMRYDKKHVHHKIRLCGKYTCIGIYQIAMRIGTKNPLLYLSYVNRYLCMLSD